MKAKKSGKTLAISLASLLMASVMALPTSAASGFTPNAKNFVPLFDFDTVPTAKYSDGLSVGNYTQDTIGDGRKKNCVMGDNYGIAYNLKIVKGKGYKGLCLQHNVAGTATDAGSYDPIALNCQYGENKNPGVKAGTADALVFWVDFRNFQKTEGDKDSMNKGILMYMQEKDYDANGVEQKASTAWMPKPNSVYYLMVNGSWVEKKTIADRSYWITSDVPNFCGWVKFPIANMTYPDTWGQDDVDKKFDGKCIQQINLGSGNYLSEIGSVLYYDEFGLEGNFPTVSTTTTKAPVSNATTISAIVSGATDTTAVDSNVSEDSSDTSETEETAAITTKATKTTSTIAAGPVENQNKTPWAAIITIIVVVVLAGAGVGVYFFYKKIKKDGYSSFADYFKNRKKSGQDLTK